MNKFLFVLISIVCCFSCVSQKKIIAKSTIKLEGKYINIRNLIDIDGYYCIDTTNLQFGGIMFFDDGSWVYFHFRDSFSENQIKSNLSSSLVYSDKGETEWGYNWGVYNIQNDTIIVHSYNNPAFLNPIDLKELRYKVVDRQTIRMIYSKILTDKDYYKFKSPWKESPPINYTPADSLPSSDNWLKENKWIWHNESDWKEYMNRIKAEK